MNKTDEEKIISEALDILATELRKMKITISHDTGDGRLDSAVNEDSVVKNLCNIVARNDFLKTTSSRLELQMLIVITIEHGTTSQLRAKLETEMIIFFQ